MGVLEEILHHNWLVVSNIFYVSVLLGEDSHFDSYFSSGLKPPTSFAFRVGYTYMYMGNAPQFQDACHMFRVFKIYYSIPYHVVCYVYLHLLDFFMVNVGKNTIHGCYGCVKCQTDLVVGLTVIPENIGS